MRRWRFEISNDMLNKNNLNFSCKRCGYCCTFKGGYVWLSTNEVQIIASKMDLTVNEFGRKYLRKIHGHYSLIEKPNGECIMYKDGGCMIYDFRPQQCVEFPFWKENLVSQEKWDLLKRTCRGIDAC